MSGAFWHKPLTGDGEINIGGGLFVWRHTIPYQDVDDPWFPDVGKIETTFYLTSTGKWLEKTSEYDDETRKPVGDRREVTRDFIESLGISIPEEIRPSASSFRHGEDDLMAEATPPRPAIDRANGTHEVRNGHANGAGQIDELIADVTPELPIVAPTGSGQGGRIPRQRRLKAVLDAGPPHFVLDGQFLACKKEAAVHYVAELIEANGRRVAFNEWVKGYPQFDGERSDRVFKALPKSVQKLIEHGRGKVPRLKTEALAKL